MDLDTVGYVKTVPESGAWRVITKSGKDITEGEVKWPSIDQKSIETVIFMGLILPKAEKYEFYRTAVASPGSQPRLITIGIGCYCKDGIILNYMFHRIPNA